MPNVIDLIEREAEARASHDVDAFMSEIKTAFDRFNYLPAKLLDVRVEQTPGWLFSDLSKDFYAFRLQCHKSDLLDQAGRLLQDALERWRGLSMPNQHRPADEEEAP